MKIFKKSIAVVLVCIFMSVLFLSGCGQKPDDVSAVQAAGSEDAAVSSTEGTAVEDSTETDNKAIVKKIVVVQIGNDDYKIAQEKSVMEVLSRGGYTSDNSEITEIKILDDSKEGAGVVNRIMEINPDVAIINIAASALKTIVEPLKSSSIPVIITSGTENYINSDLLPKQNITGIKTMSDDMQKNAFEYLNRISPINGKKAVFITTPGRFNREIVAESLKKATGTELKDFIETTYQEEFKAAVERSNNDDEVGWILIGVWPSAKKDGSAGTQSEMAKWDRENRRKPSVTYFEVAVKMGMLAGLGVDLNTVSTQAGEMAVKILNGEKLQSMKAQDPRKINMVLNQKTAEFLNISFPSDIMGGAYRIYTDYDGNYRQAN